MTAKKKASPGKHNWDKEILNDNVREFIKGTKKESYEAQKRILEQFDGYLEKYVNIFGGGSIDLGNYDTRLFLRMFLGKDRPKTLANLSQQRAYAVKVLERFSRDDLKAHVTLVFLEVLNKYYIVEGVDALNPLTKLFRFRVKDWFNAAAKAPLFKTVEPKGSGNVGLSLEDFIDLNHNEEPDFENLEARMDLNWILNPRQPLYRALSRYERYILSLIYQEGLPIVQVAEKLERDKDTIKRHLRRALRKLEDKISDATTG